jgi:hypothetical protein
MTLTDVCTECEAKYQVVMVLAHPLGTLTESPLPLSAAESECESVEATVEARTRRSRYYYIL